MKHLTREEVTVQRLLKRSRTVAVVGASPRRERHSNAVVTYLQSVGYEVLPVRSDRQDVNQLSAYASLEDIAGSVDIVVIFRRPEAVAAHVREAAHKRAAVWLQPGASNARAEATARSLGLLLIKDRCIQEEHRRAARSAGHPVRLGVHVSRRRPSFEDDRKRPEENGYQPGGGGGRVGGGGVRAVLDEKKMVRGRPSPRRGKFKPTPS